MKRVFFILFLSTLLLPVARLAMQDSPPIRIELTSSNTSDFPTIILTSNVYDRLGQPILGLTQENFVITGDLADRATIVSVENITDNNLAFSAVLAIDTSSSMAGAPFEKAIEAAISFVNLIGPNDPVAIVAFDSTERVVQDFTTDKDTLLNAINSLSYGGKTVLYDGSLLAVQKAADSGNNRRAVILLSDGAEYGALSNSERGAALDEALKSGVPVYTIGLGYGFDRTFLQSLAGDTLAKFNESPTPDELLAIYNNLAATLRSQYVITLSVDIPADGTTYALEVQATNDAGSSTASADLRAPIPVPIVSLPNLPTSPISEPTEITAEVVADDTIETAEFILDESSAASLTEAPFSFTIDPVALSPGTHQLTFNAIDENGDIGTASGSIEVAALPSSVTLAGLPEGEISELQTVVLDITGQTPAVSATYAIDDGESQAVDDPPYNYSIDPANLTPGDHTLNVDVLNEGGITTSVSQPFTVAALPPVVTIIGIEEGQEIGEPTVVTINAIGQTPVTGITVDLDSTEIANAATGEASFTLNPSEIQPGDAELTVTAVTESGAAASQTLSFSIAALPPQVSISGITVGETVEDNRTVTVDVTSQTPVSSVTFAIDGNESDSQTETPFMFDIDVLELGAGPHILSVTATNEAGESATADTAFVISDAPSLTATALAPTNTPEPTNTSAPTNTPTNTLTATTTPDSTATTVESTQAAALVASSTADAQLGEVMTSQAVSAADAQSTLDAESSANALATQNSEATSDARATANALATQNALATRDAQATTAAEEAAIAEATENVLATSNAANTEAANEARATADIASTGTAQSTQDALATTAAQTTLAAQSAIDAQATIDAQAGPTEVAQAGTATGSDTTDETPGTSATPTILTTETQSAAAQNSSLLPILCVVAAVVLILVVLFLTVGRRRKTS